MSLNIVVAVQVRGELENKTGKVFPEYYAVSYRSQVVAGINYFIKVRESTVYPR